jgi:hypothetical protein
MPARADPFVATVSGEFMARPRLYHEDRPAMAADSARASRARRRARQESARQETRRPGGGTGQCETSAPPAAGKIASAGKEAETH